MRGANDPRMHPWPAIPMSPSPGPLTWSPGPALALKQQADVALQASGPSLALGTVISQARQEEEKGLGNVKYKLTASQAPRRME